MNIGVGLDGGGGDSNRVSSLTQEAEDRGAEPQVMPLEFGKLNRGGGPPVAL